MLLIATFSILGGAAAVLLFWDLGPLAVLMIPIAGSISGAIVGAYLGWYRTRRRSRRPTSRFAADS